MESARWSEGNVLSFELLRKKGGATFSDVKDESRSFVEFPMETAALAALMCCADMRFFQIKRRCHR